MAEPHSYMKSRLAAGAPFLLFSCGLGAMVALVLLRGIRKVKRCQTLKIAMPKPYEEFKTRTRSVHRTASGRSAETLAVHIMPLDVESCGARLTELLAEISSTNNSSCSNIMDSAIFDNSAIFGLDCEWQPETSDSGPHQLSVIQVSSLKHCFIFRPLLMTDRPNSLESVSKMDPSLATSKGRKGLVPHELRDLLEDPSVIKAGVGIIEDVRRLKRDLDISVKVKSPFQITSLGF